MLSETAQLAYDTILQKPVQGIPSWLINPMEHAVIDRLAGVPEGTYRRQPEETYLAMQRRIRTCLLDQYIPENPLTIGAHGYEGEKPRGATTGLQEIVLDGMVIDSPEAVAEHLERFVIPALRRETADFDEAHRTAELLAREREIQAKLGPSILKHPYNAMFPHFRYGAYGYANYFMAYALFPEIMERVFALEADLSVRHNRALAAVYAQGGFAPLNRLDHDMADSRGTLVDIRSLDRIWFPHFARAIQPLLQADIRLIWHCDGNLAQMVPRLLECGLRGFQGFQYEDGMDYERICRLKDRAGRDLIIIGGVSVTRTLPHGTAADVKREMAWLVQYGPPTGLILGCTSSMTPGVPWANVQTLVEGFAYYQKHGRAGL